MTFIQDFLPPLHPTGSAFRQSVWRLLLQIPYGKTTTYGEIARQLAGRNGHHQMSAQAVGGAVGHNEISIIIPCHRVVGCSNPLTKDFESKVLMPMMSHINFICRIRDCLLRCFIIPWIKYTQIAKSILRRCSGRTFFRRKMSAIWSS